MFFIVGYPRSRTAWFSHFFTEMGLPCCHDLLGKVNSLKAYQDIASKVGDSDSGLIYLAQINHLFPDAKVILIERDIDEVMKSLEKRYPGRFSNTKEVMQLAFSEFKSKANYLHIMYDDINNRLREIWEYVTDLPFDEEKANMLIKENVQEGI